MSLVSVIQWCPDTHLAGENRVFFYQLRTEYQNLLYTRKITAFLRSEDILAGFHLKGLFEAEDMILGMEIFIHGVRERQK